MLLITTIVIANEKERESIVSGHEDNYFLLHTTGNTAKGQISVKLAMFYPLNTGIYLAYTDTFWWDLVSDSKPFREHNYKPELIYQFNSHDNIFNFYIPIVDEITFSFFHKSNGLKGVDSRSIDWGLYGKVTYSFSRGNIKVGGFTYIQWYEKRQWENMDMKDYRPAYEQNIYVARLSSTGLESEKLSYTLKPTWNFTKVNHQLDIQIKLFTNIIQPYLYISWEHGYGIEGLIDYKLKENKFRIGITFK